MTETLYTKYRPQTFAEVIGQAPIVRSLKSVLAKGSNRTFLLSGPSGTGKTTLARLAAKEKGCVVEEINAAKYTGIDDMRKITDMLEFRPFGGEKRAHIVDEAHRLSTASWDCLLKPLEEPPEWMMWFLCTTNLVKVPTTIQTRCTKYALKLVSMGELRALLDEIAFAEKIELGADQDEQEAIIDLCAKRAQGSPRAAIVNLGACVGAKNKDEARKLLSAAEERGAAVDLARALMGKPSWDQIKDILKSLKDDDPESIRHVVRSYMTAVMLGDKTAFNEKHAAILEAFSTPFLQSDGMSPLVLTCAKLLF